MSIQVMKQALEALEEADIKCNFICYEVKIALRAAITEAERQEPVAKWDETRGVADRLGLAKIADETLLYTTPQPAIPAWQPIETAPRDGTPILTFSQHDNVYVVSYDDCFSAPWRIFNDQGLKERAIICWMPLPSTPKEPK